MLDLAVKDYKKSLDLDSGNVRGQFFLGRQLYEMDLFHDAIEHLQFGENTFLAAYTKKIRPFSK